MSNLDNKVHNKQIELFVAALNNVAVLTLISAVIVPALSEMPGRAPVPYVWFFVALALHLIAQALYFLLRSED